MKYLYIILFLFLAGCGNLSAGYDGDPLIKLEALNSPTYPGSPLPTNTLTSTATIAPSSTPTIDTQATAMSAKETEISAVQTSMEADRIRIEITTAYEQRIHDEKMAEQAGLLAAINATGTQALTAVVGTSTQQAFINNAISTQQAYMQTSVVMTQQAPAQLIQMAEAQARADTAKQNAVVNSIAIFAMSIFLIVFSYLIYKLVINRPDENLEEPALDVPEDLSTDPIVPEDIGVPITVSKGLNSPYPETLKYVIPCTEAQLTRLAHAVLIENRSLRINNWEGKKEPLFSREKFSPIRAWLQLNQFVLSIRGGRVEPTKEFLQFLDHWIQNKSLPHRYSFSPTATDSPSTKPHEHEAHAPISSVGEGLQALNAQNILPEGSD